MAEGTLVVELDVKFSDIQTVILNLDGQSLDYVERSALEINKPSGFFNRAEMCQSRLRYKTALGKHGLSGCVHYLKDGEHRSFERRRLFSRAKNELKA